MDESIMMAYKALEKLCLDSHPDRRGDGVFFRKNWPLVKEAEKGLRDLGIDPKSYHAAGQDTTAMYTADGLPHRKTHASGPDVQGRKIDVYI